MLAAGKVFPSFWNHFPVSVMSPVRKCTRLRGFEISLVFNTYDKIFAIVGAFEEGANAFYFVFLGKSIPAIPQITAVLIPVRIFLFFCKINSDGGEMDQFIYRKKVKNGG